MTLFARDPIAWNPGIYQAWHDKYGKWVPAMWAKGAPIRLWRETLKEPGDRESVNARTDLGKRWIRMAAELRAAK